MSDVSVHDDDSTWKLLYFLYLRNWHVRHCSSARDSNIRVMANLLDMTVFVGSWGYFLGGLGISAIFDAHAKSVQINRAQCHWQLQVFTYKWKCQFTIAIAIQIDTFAEFEFAKKFCEINQSGVGEITNFYFISLLKMYFARGATFITLSRWFWAFILTSCCVGCTAHARPNTRVSWAKEGEELSLQNSVFVGLFHTIAGFSWSSFSNRSQFLKMVVQEKSDVLPEDVQQEEISGKENTTYTLESILCTRFWFSICTILTLRHIFFEWKMIKVYAICLLV